ncbi:MAG TPA: type II secretion system protein [Solirubrobacterales bacterium]
MFLQNLRARMSARLSGDREAGFTLIELLVVMLILGILAAIAIPSFFNQRDKGTDAQAKAAARTAQTAIETYATDNGGKYTGATAAKLKAIEPSLNDSQLQEPVAEEKTYTITVKSEVAGQEFMISRTAEGILDSDCNVNGTAGCPEDGNWAASAPAAP